MFNRVLVANRGEIAVRICRTLRRMGIESVVLASIPDRALLATRVADYVAPLNGYNATDTYLDQDAVLDAARGYGCDAVHPGYGFLAENAGFADRCAKTGIVFVGPSPRALRELGDKSAARQIAAGDGVPVVPGYDGDDDARALTEAADAIGFPVVIKARAGGGGRGMRVVARREELPFALDSARAEAASAFGDGSLLLEKLVTDAHHVEVQVIGDRHGALIHLGERDCSVQRRHQKVIEESPSPIVDEALRLSLTGAAVRVARAVGYENAGTFEFLVGASADDGIRPFWFIEANPRLQVEHPVTESVTGIDLVELQLRVAAGEPLPVRQDEVTLTGHAVEARLYAEDPSAGFEPRAGRIEQLSVPDTARWDAGYAAGDSVPPHYDAMVGKLIVHAASRDVCVAALGQSLRAARVDGPATNLALLRTIAGEPHFRVSDVTVDWLDRQVARLAEAPATPESAWLAAAAVAGGQGPWLGAGPRIVWLSDGATTRDLAVTRTGHTTAEVQVRDSDAATVRFAAGQSFGTPLPCTVNGVSPLLVETANGGVRVTIGGDQYLLAPVLPPPLPRSAAAAVAGATAVTAPLAGTVTGVHVVEGEAVTQGQLLATLEAMKIEHRIVALGDGTVAAAPVVEGDHVSTGQVLIELS